MKEPKVFIILVFYQAVFRLYYTVQSSNTSSHAIVRGVTPSRTVQPDLEVSLFPLT